MPISFNEAKKVAYHVQPYDHKRLVRMYIDSLYGCYDLFYSYDALVACSFTDRGKTITYITDQKYSCTTTKHCNIIRKETNALTVTQDELIAKVNSLLNQ
jgi:hypothetical protein